MNTIELNNKDAELFMLFRQHQDTFSEMVKAKVFEIRNGSATLDFSHTGELMDIRTNIVAFKRRKTAP